MDLSACDIGCDEYGYPIRQQSGERSYAAAKLAVVKAEIRRLRVLPPWNTSLSPAGLAAGMVPNAPVARKPTGAAASALDRKADAVIVRIAKPKPVR